MAERVRLAVVGAGRGASFGHVLQALKDKAEFLAVCDLNEQALAQWKDQYPGIRAYNDYDKLLEDPDVDAVFVATPLFVHARQAIAALRAGKHVISEVIAAHTMDEAWELVEAVEQSGKTYMLSENYCYMRANMMIKNMVENGVFGELTSVEGGYIHDVRTLFHYADGELTWRGKLMKDFNGSTYPTHSLGPVAQWLGINQEGGDRLDTLVTVASKPVGAARYFERHFTASHPGASRDYWSHGDAVTTLIRTKNGVLITLKYDVQSSRPHNMAHYALQGAKGAYLGPRTDGESHLVWVEGSSPSEHQWESLWNYEGQWEHPMWKQYREEAEEAGHGGGDYFVLHEFVSAILEQRKPAIDVYDAVTWSCIFPLSAQSLAQGGAPVQIPDFRRGRRAAEQEASAALSE